VAGALIGSGLVFVVLFPQFREPLTAQRNRMTPFENVDYTGRLDLTLEYIRTFFVERRLMTDPRRIVITALMVLVPVALLAWQVRSGARAERSWRDALRERDSGFWDVLYVVVLALVILLAVTLLYVLGFSPPHAMHSRYLSYAWVFVAFLPVVLIRLPVLKRWRDGLLLAAMVTMLASGSIALVKEYNAVQDENNPAHFPDGHERIVIASTGRGVLFEIVLNLDDDNQVFVAQQDDLLAEPEKWLPQVEESGETWYFAGTQPVLELLRAEGMTVQRIPTYWKSSASFRLTR
jgi:hypothetical protein